MTLLWILFFSVLGSAGAISLAGIFLLLKDETRQALVPLLVAYATGTLLGAALLALLPHVLEEIEPIPAFGTVLAGILVLFLFEKIVILRHCHNDGCDRHAAAGVLILIGDAFHNFVDGVAIAAAFLSSIPLGIATGLAAISHEIPQEVGDFVILLNSGYSRGKAFLYNIISGMATIVGALGAYLLLARIEPSIPYILAVAAASFLYIGMADLVPHLHERPGLREGIFQVILIIAGIMTILLMEL